MNRRHSRRARVLGEVSVSDVISLLRDGPYESGHWMQRALGTLPTDHVPSDICADVERAVRKAVIELESEISGERLRLYRGLREPLSGERAIGAHWTVSLEVASTFGEYVYAVDAALGEVDWVATVGRRIAWPIEREVAVHADGRLLRAAVINVNENKGAQLGNESDDVSESAGNEGSPLPPLSELAGDAGFAISDLLGDSEWVAFDALTDVEKVRFRYLHGDCDDLALALHLALGWNVRAVTCERGCLHRLVSHPDGRLLDASGWTTESALKARYGVGEIRISPDGEGLSACQSVLDPDDPVDFHAVAAALLYLDGEPFVTELRSEIEVFAARVGLDVWCGEPQSKKAVRP